MDQNEYEKDLKRRQEEHLKNISVFKNSTWQPCLHDQCISCYGTGLKRDGSTCMHFISCPCPKCSPQCLASNNMHKIEITEIYNKLQTKIETPLRHTKVVDWDNVESVFENYFQS